MADRREVAGLLASHHPAFSYALQGPDGITAVVPRCFADQTILRSRYDLIWLHLFPFSHYRRRRRPRARLLNDVTPVFQ
jgi:hypothetical protein